MFHSTEPITVSVKDAASASGLSEYTIRHLVYDGHIEARRSGARVLILHRSLRDYIANLESAAR
jgi:excisionase family DNA binding protein